MSHDFDNRIVQPPHSVRPLDGLAVPLSGEEVDWPEGDDEDDDDEEEEEEEEEQLEVWDRLMAEGERRLRTIDARHALNEHRKEQEELSRMYANQVRCRSWSPSRSRLQRRRTITAPPPPNPDIFTFSPRLSETTHRLAEGTGSRVWTHLSRRRECSKGCSPPKRAETPPPPKLSPRAKREAHSRLYNDAFKSPAERTTFNPPTYSFHPQISPRSEHMVRNRSLPAHDRLSQSPSPRVVQAQVMEAGVSGVAVRRGPSLAAERVRVLRKGDIVSVNVDNLIATSSGALWGQVTDGWCQIATPDGREVLLPARSCSPPTPPRQHRLSARRVEVLRRRLRLQDQLDELSPFS